LASPKFNFKTAAKPQQIPSLCHLELNHIAQLQLTRQIAIQLYAPVTDHRTPGQRSPQDIRDDTDLPGCQVRRSGQVEDVPGLAPCLQDQVPRNPGCVLIHLPKHVYRFAYVHRESKKHATKLLFISSPNIDRF